MACVSGISLPPLFSRANVLRNRRRVGCVAMVKWRLLDARGIYGALG